MSIIQPGQNFQRFVDQGVIVKGNNRPDEILQFQDAGLEQSLLNLLREMNLVNPTPIQKFAIPIIMAGRNLLARSETGSGKTIAYLVPIIDNLLKNFKPPKVGANNVIEPQVLILAPTREVALQIQEECFRLTMGSGLVTLINYGGVSVKVQAKNNSQGGHILVATPGRLKDFLERGFIRFSQIRFVVFDEADAMVQNDFRPVVRKMMNHKTMVPKTKRQTLMFSALSPRMIKMVADKFMADYLEISSDSVYCPDIIQQFILVKPEQKQQKLIELLLCHRDKPNIVFVGNLPSVSLVASFLGGAGFNVTTLSSGRGQGNREQALSSFRHGLHPILVTTDIASRGLNISRLLHVVNYDMPAKIPVYVYRIGRVGRLGNPGLATSFFTEGGRNEAVIARELVDVLAATQQKVPLFMLQYLLGTNETAGARRRMFHGVRSRNRGASRRAARERDTPAACNEM